MVKAFEGGLYYEALMRAYEVPYWLFVCVTVCVCVTVYPKP